MSLALASTHVNRENLQFFFKLITSFPYGLVRHPAASGFLWMYWFLPAYTPTHILLASLWTIFILVGTLEFEEGGLRGEDEFGKAYVEYSKNVAALYPTPKAIMNSLCPVHRVKET